MWSCRAGTGRRDHREDELPWPVFAPDCQDANVPLLTLTAANRDGNPVNTVPRAAQALAAPATGGQGGENARQPARPAAPGAGPSAELGDAVQMTRNAVVAWVRVSDGAGIVNVTAR